MWWKSYSFLEYNFCKICSFKIRHWHGFPFKTKACFKKFFQSEKKIKRILFSPPKHHFHIALNMSFQNVYRNKTVLYLGWVWLCPLSFCYTSLQSFALTWPTLKSAIVWHPGDRQLSSPQMLWASIRPPDSFDKATSQRPQLWRDCWPQFRWQDVLSLWDSRGRMLLITALLPRKETDVRARFRWQPGHHRGTGCDGGGRKGSWHLAACAEARPERGQWGLCLSKISDLLPANLELDFLVEGGGEGKGWKRQMPREIIDLATRQKMLWMAPEGERDRAVQAGSLTAKAVCQSFSFQRVPWGAGLFCPQEQVVWNERRKMTFNIFE